MFESRFIGAESSTNLTVTGVKEPCPTCGTQASQMIEGTFDVDASGNWRLLASVLRPKEAQIDDYLALRDLLKNSKSADLNLQQSAEQLRQSVPVFGELADWMGSQRGGSAAGWLTLLATIVIWLLSHSSDGATPPNITNNITINLPTNTSVPSVEDLEREIKRLKEAKNTSPSPEPRP